jgi:hypothetical protein
MFFKSNKSDELMTKKDRINPCHWFFHSGEINNRLELANKNLIDIYLEIGRQNDQDIVVFNALE